MGLRLSQPQAGVWAWAWAELGKRHLEFHSSVIHSILRPVPESSVIHWPISSTLKTVKKTTKISILTKWIPVKTMKSHIQKKV